jgi:hypothetical protein
MSSTAVVDGKLVERVASRFDEDVRKEAQRIDGTRDATTLREILSFGSDAIGVATGIYFVINYLIKRASSARDGAIQALRSDIESLPPSTRAKGNEIIDAVRDELSK